MYRKIKNLLIRNFHWKLFSIFMATLLWLIVMNINNPTEIKTFSLGIELINDVMLKQKDIAILNLDEIKNQKIEVKIKATRPIIDEVSQKIRKEDIKIPIDLSKLMTYKIGDEPIDIPMPLDPRIPSIAYLNSNFEIFSFSPRVIAITLDNIETIQKKVQINIKGKPKLGYVYDSPELSSEYINVTGAKSLIDKVDSIYLYIDVNGKDEDIKEDIEPIAYDKESNEIKDVTFNMDKVSVKMSIKQEGSVSILSPNIIGKVRGDSIIKSIEYSPKDIQVVGSKNDIANTKQISLPIINIDNLSKTKTFTYNVIEILRKHNLSIKDNKKVYAVVTVNVQKKGENTLTVPTSRLKISGFNDDYDISMPKHFDIELEGESTAINSLDIDDISCSINMEGLKEGEHRLKIDVVLPEVEGELVLSKNSFIDVVISTMKEDESSTKDEIADNTTEESTEKSTKGDDIKDKNIEDTTNTNTEENTENTTEKSIDTMKNEDETIQKDTTKNNTDINKTEETTKKSAEKTIKETIKETTKETTKETQTEENTKIKEAQTENTTNS